MKKTHTFLSLVKGGIVGIVSLIPFVSSGSVLYSLSVYNNFIEGLSSFKNNKKLYLISIPVIIGILGGIFGGAHIINYVMNKWPNIVIFLIIGILFGGLKLHFKNSSLKLSLKNIIIFLLIVSVFVVLYILFLKHFTFNVPSNIFLKFLFGLMSGLAFIIPGYPVSSFLIDNIHGNSLISILVFSIGTLIGIIIIAKIIFMLSKRFVSILEVIFFSLVVVSIVILFLNVHYVLSFTFIITSLLALLWGYILVINLEKENDK